MPLTKSNNKIGIGGIETVYDTFKNKFMLENFTGNKPVIMEQDILPTMENDSENRGKIFEGGIEDMARNIVLVRENRQFQHRNKHPAVKHPVTKNAIFSIVQ